MRRGPGATRGAFCRAAGLDVRWARWDLITCWAVEAGYRLEREPGVGTHVVGVDAEALAAEWRVAGSPGDGDTASVVPPGMRLRMADATRVTARGRA